TSVDQRWTILFYIFCKERGCPKVAIQLLLGQPLFLFPPLLHPHYGINNRIMKNILIMTNVKKTLSL
ncbi:hypothetical protein, partial [Bacillus paranthracis]|uniref:hypothetical protein n=1 Tax=Bacillus paranthracis TaxID=2026186 RepID=UPI002E1B8B13|nr:hypothetical protein [Bacillus paranthracis]